MRPKPGFTISSILPVMYTKFAVFVLYSGGVFQRASLPVASFVWWEASKLTVLLELGLNYELKQIK